MNREKHELDYDLLAKEYVENLHTTLRNFTPGPDFLETWVYEENHNSSVLGILESADEADLAEVKIKISRAIVDEMDLETLKAESKYMPRLTLAIDDQGANGVVITGTFQASTTTEEYNINSVYERNVRHAAEHIRNEGELPEAGLAEVAVETTKDGMTLKVLVNTESHQVTTARHQNASGLQKVLLDSLCSLLEKRTLQEGRDHATLRLEYKLRDFSVPHPVAGIIIPDNADPAFATPRAMVRDLYEKYREKTGAPHEKNFWDDAPAEVWKNLDTSDKMDRAKFALEGAITELNLSGLHCEVVDVKDDVRIVLSYGAGENPLAPHLIKLERILRRTLDSRLELQMESLVDKNKRESRTKRNKAFKH